MQAKMREGQSLEFKLVWNENACKTVCAFANTEGGKLYIGYDDNGSLVGLKKTKSAVENLPNLIRSRVGIFVSIYSRLEDGKEYLEITVPAMDHPVFYEGKVYIRVGSTNQLLEGNDLVSFILRKSAESWDAVTVPDASVDDLDAESFKILLDDGIRNKRLTEYDRALSRQELLEKLSLVKGGKLTRAAILLFHPHPERFFGGAHIKLGYFSERNLLRYQDELYGSLFSLAKKAEELLVLKYFYATIDYDGLVRAETLPYPREAVREGLLNALMHNNYMSSQPIAVRVSPRELWISNKCVFPAGWTEETLFSVHESRQLNPNIAAGFFRAGLVERFGSGVQKIVESCSGNGNPRPSYSISPDILTLKIPSRPENIDLALSVKERPVYGARRKNEGATPKDEDRTLANDGAKAFNEGANSLPASGHGKVAARRKAILHIMAENGNVTAAKLADVLDISDATIERDLSWLKASGFIARSGSDKAGRWAVLKEF